MPEKSGNLEKSKEEIKNQIFNYFTKLIQENPAKCGELQQIRSKCISVSDNNPEFGMTLYKLPIEFIKSYMRADNDIIHCKWKSYINKNFSDIHPNLSFLDIDTTKYFFITIRPKWKTHSNLLGLFKLYIELIFDSVIFDWGIGCWEITAGEGDRLHESLHTHIITKLDHGNPSVKKNNGKAYVLKEIKRKIKTIKFKQFLPILTLGDFGLQIDVHKGFQGAKKYICGDKKDASKQPDIDVCRKWRMENRIPNLYYLKNKDNIPNEIIDSL